MMVGVWVIKVFLLHLIVFIVCPIVFVLTARMFGRWFNLEVAPDSLVAKLFKKS